MNAIKVYVLKRQGCPHFYMQYRHPVTRRNVRRSTKRTSRREAEREAQAWERELQSGFFRRGEEMTWQEFRDRYDNEVLSGLKDSTARKVTGVFNVLERLIQPELLIHLTTDSLSKLRAELRKAGREESTIQGHLGHISAALAWAVEVGLLPHAPKKPKVKRAKKASGKSPMKGRPITGEEFERMLAKVEAGLMESRKPDANSARRSSLRTRPETIANHKRRMAELVSEAAPSWKRLLKGLWLSGLRLEEALNLWWDRPDKIMVDLSGHFPVFAIKAELEKGHKDRSLPMTPDFADFLLQTPEADRTGPVFNPLPIRGGRVVGERLTAQRVGVVISRIGKAAGVIVRADAGGKVKYASAHDLRRSFGDRWAQRVLPQVLKELMRHESLETTMRYYVTVNAQRTAAALWEGWQPARSKSGLGAKMGASQKSRRKRDSRSALPSAG